MRRPRATLFATLESLSSSRKYGGLIPTFEMISFQNDDKFGADLEVICAEYIDFVKQGQTMKAIEGMAEPKKRLEETIFRRTGMKVKLTTNGHDAAIIPNYYTPHNVIANDYLRGFLQSTSPSNTTGWEELSKMANQSLGTINFDTAKMTGWFSEQEIPLFMNFYRLVTSEDSSPAELTAIILHELGHAFNAAAFINQTHSANQILSDIATTAVKKNGSKAGKGEIEYIYKEMKKIDPNAAQELAQGMVSGNPPVMGVSLFRTTVGAVTTLMADKTYDRVMNEAMADNFATRFGYGGALVSGLEKLERINPEYKTMRERARILMMVAIYCVIMTTAAIMAPFIGISILTPVAMFYSYITIKILGMVAGSEGRPRIYDDIKQRYIRIRNQLVENIKDPTINRELRKHLLADITTIDAIVDSKETYTAAIDTVFDFFSPTNRRAKKSIEAQQQMEALIANRLFVQAAKLKT